MFPGSFPKNSIKELASITLGVAATSITLNTPSLPLDESKSYLLDIKLIASAGGNPGANLTVNGTAGGSGYIVSRATGSSAMNGSTSTLFIDAEGILAGYNNITKATLSYNANLGWYILTNTISQAGANYRNHQTNSLFPSTVVPITTLTISSGGAPTYAPGSFIKLFAVDL